MFDFRQYLFTLDSGLAGGLEHQVFQDGSEGGHSNSSSHQNRHFIVSPLLMALAKRAIQVQLRMTDNVYHEMTKKRQAAETVY